ncbi:MAG: ABC transporter substrate-binding protein [Deltaproteobacteria bacterium]|nr:ABC transporter substrate-binding protein [Deltaproteobacteria bacterium]
MKATKAIVSFIALAVFIGTTLFSVPPAFSQLIKTDVITTEPMKMVWGYCPYGMLETSVMKVKKFYKKYLPNLEVEWFFGLWSVHLINNWIAGKLEVAYLGNMPAVMLEAKMKNTKWVGVAVYPHGEVGAIFVPKDSPVKDVKELDGATVATGVGSSHHRILEEVARQEGIKFNIVSQNPEVAIGNMEAGKLQAMCYWPPYNELLIEKGIGRPLEPRHLKKYEPYVNAIWPIVVSERFAKEHPDIVRGLIKADNDLHDFMVQHPDEAAQIVYEELEKKIPVESLKRSLARYQYSNELTDEHIEVMQRDIDFLYEKKFIKEHFKAADWVDNSFYKDKTK